MTGGKGVRDFQKLLGYTVLNQHGNSLLFS